MKLSWSCPRWTRTFFLQHVLSYGMTSVRTDILSRYGKFSRSLRTSISQEIRVLFNIVARDLQSTTAKNIKFVESQSESELLSSGPNKLKEALHNKQQVSIPQQELWKVVYLKSLLRKREEAKYLVQEDLVSQLQQLIDSLVR